MNNQPPEDMQAKVGILLERYVRKLREGDHSDMSTRNAAILGCVVLADCDGVPEGWSDYFVAGLQERGVRVNTAAAARQNWSALARIACASVEPPGSYQAMQLVNHLIGED